MEKDFNSHLTKDQLQNYTRNTCKEEESSAIENHLATCELCSDAVNGFGRIKTVSNIYSVTNDIRRKRIRKLKIHKPIFSYVYVITVASILFVLAIIIFVMFYFNVLGK